MNATMEITAVNSRKTNTRAFNPSRLTRIKIRSVILQHAIAWVIYIVYSFLLNLITNPDEHFLDIVFANLLSIWTFYAGYFCLNIAFLDKKPLKAFLLWICGLIVLFGLRYIYAFVLLDLIGLKPYTTDTVRLIIRDSILLYMRFFLYSVGFYYARKAILKERQLRVAEEEKFHLQEEKLRLEKMHIQSEYAFLRSQINPHFLQNTLNFFYSKSMNVSRQLSDGILLLAEIMRYALATDEVGDGKVLLSKEIEHLKNIIKISQLRFSGGLYINFSIDGPMEGIRIIPFVLISLAENTFKHGELLEEDNPVTITLKIDAEQQRLLFDTCNKKTTGPKELSSGIGLVNIRKRLEWMYGHNFSFTIKEEGDIYKTHLEIKY
ncbi:MAG TPA: histidine kinase [Chitinophaga sp.]|uniref:sensor histidine kinase n=1 Tax=Chitinophaga sp. TaxID=1869181 RepID=UPI002F937681